MKTLLISFVLLLVLSLPSFAQNDSLKTQPKLKPKKENTEKVNNWSVNLTFSDNGFGLGATKFMQLSRDASGFASIQFSGAKDDREFEETDIFGNTYTPFKVNRLFMSFVSLGVQFRLFREDVTDNLRPHINFGAAPAMIMYTPYDKSFFSSFKYAQAKYTVGAFAGIGLDYVTNNHSSLNMDVRYYFINLFGQGVYSISTNEKKYFGGVYFVFSYNFLH